MLSTFWIDIDFHISIHIYEKAWETSWEFLKMYDIILCMCILLNVNLLIGQY